jgi:hypothetical protein
MKTCVVCGKKHVGFRSESTWWMLKGFKQLFGWVCDDCFQAVRDK